MTQINAASAVNPTPGPAEGDAVGDVVGIVRKAIRISAADLAQVFGAVADALPLPMSRFGGIFGFGSKSLAEKKAEAEDWKTILDYLEVERKRVLLTAGKDDLRLKLLETAIGGLRGRYNELKKDIPILRAGEMNERTDVALVKLGIVIDSPEALKYFAHRLGIIVEERTADDVEARRNALAAETGSERRILEGERSTLLLEDALLDGTLKARPFDGFPITEEPKSLARIFTTTPPKNIGVEGWKQSYKISLTAVLDLQRARRYERADGPQAQEIERAMATFAARVHDTASMGKFEPMPFKAFHPNPMSMENACRVLSQVHSKLATPEVVRLIAIRSQYAELASRETKLAGREAEVRGLSLTAAGHRRVAKAMGYHLPAIEMPTASIAGDKDSDRFLSELEIDKNEWDRAKASGTEGSLISEKLRDPECKVHPALSKALFSAESWLEDNLPYKDQESFRRDLIKAYVAGLNATSPGEASKLVNDVMAKHLKADKMGDAELTKARAIIDRVEKAAEKERKERDDKEKKGI